MEKRFNHKLYKKKFVRYLKDNHAYASFVNEFSHQKCGRRTQRFADKSLNFTLEHITDYYKIAGRINLKRLFGTIIDGSLTFIKTKCPSKWCGLVSDYYPIKPLF